MHVSLVEQLAGLHEMHLALRGEHRGCQDDAIQAPRVSQGHHAVLRPTPTVRHLLLVELVAKGVCGHGTAARQSSLCVPDKQENITVTQDSKQEGAR